MNDVTIYNYLKGEIPKKENKYFRSHHNQNVQEEIKQRYIYAEY